MCSSVCTSFTPKVGDIERSTCLDLLPTWITSQLRITHIRELTSGLFPSTLYLTTVPRRVLPVHVASWLTKGANMFFSTVGKLTKTRGVGTQKHSGGHHL